jgi:diguanylate cyclase (GGDEF)-like protein
MLAAWAILLVGVSASAIGGRYIQTRTAADEKNQFAAVASELGASIGSSVQKDTNFVAAERALVTSDPTLTNAEFKLWYESLGVASRYPGGIGAAYFERVPASGLAAFADGLRVDPVTGLPLVGPLVLVPPGGRSEYCLQRLGVFTAGARLPLPIGFDECASDIPGFGVSPTAPALRIAQDTGQFTVVPPVKSYEFAGFLVYAPVYGGTVPATQAARHATLVGWIQGSFDGTAILRDALGSRGGISIELSHQDLGATPVVIAHAGATAGGRMKQSVMVGADGQWLVQVAGGVGGGLSARGQGLGVLAAGLAVTLLLFLLVRILAGSRARALVLVDNKTGELRHQALHDPLTGLPNRALILDRVEQMLARARRDRTPVAALFIDLDNFKDVNDTLGHAAGDELLQAVAGRLSGVLRESDTVGRLGGDEFVVLVEGRSLAAGPEVVAERLLDVLREPFQQESEPTGIRLTVSASIGIAVGERSSAGELLRDADIALYQAKAAGKDRSVLFVHAMRTAVTDRLELEADLRGALAAGEFFLVYQPIFNLTELSVTGVEALIRWHHPTRGIVQPDEFIPLLEETGLIVSIGRWVLDQACEQAVAWRTRGHNVAVSVNVSARQLESDQLLVDVRNALARTGLDPASLVIEITETTLMLDAEETVRRLMTLKALGVRIAIDDFGTGYSSLAYLRQFPVDSLKIDRSFIKGMTDSAESTALMHTLIQLGKTLGLQIVAEGIEETDQLGHLRSVQCDSGQGFLFARPLDVDAVEDFFDVWLPSQVLDTPLAITARPGI